MAAISNTRSVSLKSETSVAPEKLARSVWFAPYAALVKIIRAFRMRSETQELQMLDDHILRDVGLKREDVGFPDKGKADLFKNIGW